MERADVFYKGLTDAEAENSRLKHGSNDIIKRNKNSFFKEFIAAFGDPIIKILLIALFVNILFIFKNSNWYEVVGIAVAVLLATLVSTLSEYGSESAFEKLREEASKIKCRVKRADGIIELPVSDIVVGDIVLLQAGERIPADGKIITGRLSVDQSALNGESKEVEKEPASTKFAEKSDFLTLNKLFRGSIVCSGEGELLVESVGENTFYGRLALEIQEETIESPLKSRLAHLAQSISVFGYAAAAIVILSNLFNNIFIANNFNPHLITNYLSNRNVFIQDLLNTITLGITVIVMAVPEGLPMMITVVLSSNMRRMLKDNVLVRKLVGIETSGSLNILFTDKTGTLTKGKLEVTSFIDSHGKEYSDLSSLKKNTELFKLIKLNCFYNNSSRITVKDLKKFVTGGNSTDRALLEYILHDINHMSGYTRGIFIPFNSRDKFSAAEVGSVNGKIYFVKGAPENLLPYCKYAYEADGEKKNFINTAALKNTLDRLTSDSIRLLALCTCEDSEIFKEKKMTLIGFLGIRDELRKEAKAAIREISGAKIQVVMITGDNKDTAVSIAKKAGLIKEKESVNAVITSSELQAMSDDELKKCLPELRVIARALPSDKSRLIRVSQEMGLVAGMTGDGVNDAPALKKADVGFAMGDGAEIAKEAGDIVILDNNISSISKAILYGRTIFKSIRKFIIFQLTVNLCAVGVSIIGPFIGVEFPVTIIQMLWINIIMDTLAGLAFAGETPLPEYMKEVPKDRNEKIINGYMYGQILFTGIYTMILCLLFLKLPVMRSIFAGESHFLTAFFALFIFAGIFNSFNSRTYRINLLAHILKNKAFLFIMLIVSAVQLLLIYRGGTLFRTSGLTLNELILVLLLAVSVIYADLIRKLILRAYKKKGSI